MSTTLARLQPLLTVETFTEGSEIPPVLVAELVRIDAAAQLEVVALFVAAADRYDDGHRPDEGTTMDVLLDEVFPAFGSTALLALFSRFRNLAYYTRDRFDALFAPALRNLDTTADGPKVAAWVAAYVEEVLEDDDPDAYVVTRLREVFDEVATLLPAALRGRFDGRIAKAEGHAAWCAQEATRFQTMPSEQLAALLAREGRELAFGHPLSDALCEAMIARLSELSFEAIEAFVVTVVDDPEIYALTSAFPYLFLKEAGEAPAALLRLAARGPAQRAGMIVAVECLVRWIGEDPNPFEPLRKRITAKPIVATMKKALTELKRFRDRAQAQEAGALPAQFAAIMPAELERELRERGPGYVVGHPAAHAFQHAVLRHLAALPFDALAALATRCIRSNAYQAMVPALAFMFLRDAAQAGAFVNPPPPGNARGTLNTALMELERGDPGSGRDAPPWEQAIQAAPATLAVILAARAQLQQAFLSPLERV